MDCLTGAFFTRNRCIQVECNCCAFVDGFNRPAYHKRASRAIKSILMACNTADVWGGENIHLNASNRIAHNRRWTLASPTPRPPEATGRIQSALCAANSIIINIDGVFRLDGRWSVACWNRAASVSGQITIMRPVIGCARAPVRDSAQRPGHAQRLPEFQYIFRGTTFARSPPECLCSPCLSCGHMASTIPGNYVLG